MMGNNNFICESCGASPEFLYDIVDHVRDKKTRMCSKCYSPTLKDESFKEFIGPLKELKAIENAIKEIETLKPREKKRAKRYLIQRFEDELGVE